MVCLVADFEVQVFGSSVGWGWEVRAGVCRTHGQRTDHESEATTCGVWVYLLAPLPNRGFFQVFRLSGRNSQRIFWKQENGVRMIGPGPPAGYG